MFSKKLADLAIKYKVSFSMVADAAAYFADEQRYSTAEILDLVEKSIKK